MTPLPPASELDELTITGWLAGHVPAPRGSASVLWSRYCDQTAPTVPTLRSVGARYGVSHETVRQREIEALHYLRGSQGRAAWRPHAAQIRGTRLATALFGPYAEAFIATDAVVQECVETGTPLSGMTLLLASTTDTAHTVGGVFGVPEK